MKRFVSNVTARLNAKGRVLIPDAGTLIGLGHKFQLWEPGRFRDELAEATRKVRALRSEPGSQAAARAALGARE